MSVLFSWEDLFAAVDARFTAEQIGAPNLFGFNVQARQTVTGPRVLWVPGDDSSGDLGEIKGANRPGGNPRNLLNVHELFTIYCVSGDVTTADDDLANYHAARILMDQVLRAVTLHCGGYGNFAVKSAAWVLRRAKERQERRWGAAIRLVLARPSLVPDEVITLAPVDTLGEVTVQLGENPSTTEVFEVTP